MGFLHFTIIDFIDILLVAYIMYELYRIIKGTVALDLFILVLILYIVYLVIKALNMRLLSAILGNSIGVGVIAILIVFQQEVKRFLLSFRHEYKKIPEKIEHFLSSVSGEEKPRVPIDEIIEIDFKSGPESELAKEIDKKVLGIVWDGVGLGDDGQIWGGEFFIYDKNKMKKTAHFEYFTHLALDKFAMEPRLPAFSVCKHIPEAEQIIHPKFTQSELNNYRKLIAHHKAIKTCSAGRLFDAIASLLNIRDKNSFEGEAAMLLENIALDFYLKNKNYSQFYNIEFINNQISTSYLTKQIIRDIINKVDKQEIAFKFHLSLIEIIKLVAEKHQIKNLTFSGGVFQNALLVDLIHQYLKVDYHLYFHKQLSPNDENISFGQLVYASVRIDN